MPIKLEGLKGPAEIATAKKSTQLLISKSAEQ